MSFRPSAYGSSLAGTSHLPLHPQAPSGPPHIIGGDARLDSPPSVSLLLTNLPKDATEDEFEVLFRPFGEIKALQIQQNPNGHAQSAYVHLFSYPDTDPAKLRKSLSIRGCHLRVTFVDNPPFDDGGPPLRYTNRGRSHANERSSRGGGRGNRYFDNGVHRNTQFSDRNSFRMRKGGTAYTSSMKRPRGGDLAEFNPSGSLRVPSETSHYKGLQKNEQGEENNFPPPNTAGARNLYLCDIVKQVASHVFFRTPIPDGAPLSLSSAVGTATSTQSSMISSLKQPLSFPTGIPLNLAALGIPHLETITGAANTFTVPTGILPATAASQFVDTTARALSNSNKLLPPLTPGLPSNLLPSTPVALPTMIPASISPPASSRPIPTVVWRGILARNDKKRVNVNAISLVGNVAQLLMSSTILNVAHRLKWEEVAARLIYAVCYFEVAHEEQKPAFVNYLEYFITKDRAGAVTLREDFLLYLIPPKVDFFRQLALPEGLPENILIGLFGSAVPQNAQKLPVPPSVAFTAPQISTMLPSTAQTTPHLLRQVIPQVASQIPSLLASQVPPQMAQQMTPQIAQQMAQQMTPQIPSHLVPQSVPPHSTGSTPPFTSNAALSLQQPSANFPRMPFPSSQAASTQPNPSMANPPSVSASATGFDLVSQLSTMAEYLGGSK